MINPNKFICFNCKNFTPDQGGCKAYPNGIPYDITELGASHDKVRPDQSNNIIYEPKGIFDKLKLRK